MRTSFQCNIAHDFLTLHFTTVLYADVECCKRPKHLKSLEKQLAFFRDTQPSLKLVSFQANTEQCNSVTFTAHTNDCWGPMPISALRLHLRQCNLHRHAETSGRCPGYMAAVSLLWFNCNSCHASYSRKWWLKVARSFPTSVSKTCDDQNWDLVTCYSSKHGYDISYMDIQCRIHT